MKTTREKNAAYLAGQLREQVPGADVKLHAPSGRGKVWWIDAALRDRDGSTTGACDRHRAGERCGGSMRRSAGTPSRSSGPRRTASESPPHPTKITARRRAR